MPAAPPDPGIPASPLRYLILLATAVLLAGPGIGPVTSAAPGPPDDPSDVRLALVDRDPLPGRAPIALEKAVASIRHDYGSFRLVRLTREQARVLREEGYQVRIFEDSDRIGLGHYGFRVPPGPVGLPPELTADETNLRRGTFLVKLIGPAEDSWLEGLRGHGAEILTPVPEFAYLVRLAPRQRHRVAALPFVEWIGTYHPAFKLDPELAVEEREDRLPAVASKLRVLVYRSSDVDEVENRIRAMGGEILDRSPFDFYETLDVRIAPSLAPELARLADVYFVERIRDPELEDESATQILAGQVAGGIPFRPGFGEATYADWLAARSLDGSNVTIGYADDGVMNADPTDHLDGRVNESVCGTAGGDGHALFGAANAGGACAHFGEVSTGYRFGTGVAPAVNFINIPFLKSTGACNHNDATRARDTVANTGPNGVPGTIQNNSWGAGARDTTYDGTYGSLERAFDLLVRDGDSVAVGNQQLTTCFSAGNDGDFTIGAAPGDSPATLTRPHVAKNIITTGSSSVYRLSAGGDNINDRSLFSSEGPTFDDRIKPDVMAPGGVEGASSAGLASAHLAGSSVAIAIGDGFHGLSAGTSFASPHTAGGAALLTQWWKRFAPGPPSPAMLKALLINASRDMEGGNTSAPGYLIPNRREGWGRWDLGTLLEPGTPTVVAEGSYFKKTSGLASIYLDQSVLFGAAGEMLQIRFVPSDVTKPMRATLAWTDAAGAVDSCPSLVNNLDLEIVQNGVSLFRGNALTSGLSVAGGPSDVRNNVEQVIQPSPSGFYTLTVRAVTIGGDGVPANGDATDQDFALVVTNAVPYTGPILSAGTIASTEACPGNGSGGDTVLDPGETLTFSVPLANSGNATATAISATLSTSEPGVTILDGSAAYPDIPAGSTGAPSGGDSFEVSISQSVPCGSRLSLQLTVGTAQGSFAVPLFFDVGSKTVTTQDLSGSTGVVSDDPVSPSLFTTPAAASGVLRSASLDLNITTISDNPITFHHFGNYLVELVSPLSTNVFLHSNPLPCNSLVTSYPGSRLAQIGTLDTFAGQDPGGIWTLRVTDLNSTQQQGGGPPRPASQIQVNSWTLHLTRESAASCNTCIVMSAPPEVSGPSAATLLELDRDPDTGVVTFTWEDQGSLSDSYRLYQGDIFALAGAGVTTANTAPVQCGIAAPGTSFVPDPGDNFYLVAGQKGALVGPLGEATDPGTYPRTADQTCP